MLDRTPRISSIFFSGIISIWSPTDIIMKRSPGFILCLSLICLGIDTWYLGEIVTLNIVPPGSEYCFLYYCILKPPSLNIFQKLRKLGISNLFVIKISPWFLPCIENSDLRRPAICCRLNFLSWCIEINSF